VELLAKYGQSYKIYNRSGDTNSSASNSSVDVNADPELFDVDINAADDITVFNEESEMVMMDNNDVVASSYNDHYDYNEYDEPINMVNNM
jgi:uncharacterized protein YneR